MLLLVARIEHKHLPLLSWKGFRLLAPMERRLACRTGSGSASIMVWRPTVVGFAEIRSVW